MNRFEELSALVAVVEHGSFSAAAERLDIAKSAVSRRVSDLEARLGVRLLNRTTRRLNLTEPGRALHERAVRIGRLANSSLVAKRLTTIDMVCVASPAYLAERGRPETPEALSEHRALRYTLAKRGTIWRFQDENGRVHQARTQTLLAANNGDHIVQACIAGLGVALVPIFIAHEAIRDGSLEVILTGYHVESAGMFLVYPSGRYLSRRVRVFSDYMEHFQEKAPWADCPRGPGHVC